MVRRERYFLLGGGILFILFLLLFLRLLRLGEELGMGVVVRILCCLVEERLCLGRLT